MVCLLCGSELESIKEVCWCMASRPFFIDVPDESGDQDEEVRR